MLKILKKIAGYFFILIGVLFIYVLFATAVAYVPVNKDQSKYTHQNLSIYILTNGVHTDIVVPYINEVYDWHMHLNPALTPGGRTSAQWVAFGWGDKGFYLQTPEWKDLKPSVAFNAAFGLSKSAMHVTYYDKMIPREDCVEIKLNHEQYQQLCAYILNRFDSDDQQLILIDTDQNYGLNDVFYEAKGKYNLFYTCNTWANSALKSAGLKACLFTLWDKGIFYHYQK
ncbi:MAG: TIGR02117 family protein [Myroides sp.]|nr:TIGR02117 family protein [Myroides sp.]